MTDHKRPTVDELLEQLRERIVQPSQQVEITASPMGNAFGASVPAEVVEELLADSKTGADGWAVAAKRRWCLEPVAGVTVYAQAGLSLEEALAQLDRVRAELVANPGLLDRDWSKPQQRRPSLRVVKGAGQG